MTSEHQQHATYGRMKSNPNILFLRGVRVGPFAALYRPAANLSGKDQYSATCIISEEQLKFLEDEMKRSAKALWKGDSEKIFKNLKSDFLAARIREDKYLGSYPSVKVTRNTKTDKGNPLPAPILKQRTFKGEPQKLCVEGEPGSVYDGCYVTLILEPKAYDFKGAKGVKFDFKGMIFEKDGEPFLGGRGISDSDFDDLAEDVSEETEDDVSW